MRITVTRSVIQAEAARKAERKAPRREQRERLPLWTRLRTLVGREPRSAEQEIEQPIREVT